MAQWYRPDQPHFLAQIDTPKQAPTVPWRYSLLGEQEPGGVVQGKFVRLRTMERDFD